MKWSKEINFMLALAVEHQMTISTNGKSQTNWKAVLEIANDIFQHIPSFSQKFPQGLSDHHKLRSQWNDRTRARKNDLTKHRHTAWVLHQDLCTDAEIQRMTPLADTVINAERVLSQRPGSSVRDPGPNALRWTQYDVTVPTARPVKRELDPSSDDENNSESNLERPRKAAKMIAAEEEKDSDDETRESSSSLAPAPISRRRRAKGTQAEASSTNIAGSGGVRGAVRLVEQYADGSSVGTEDVQDDRTAQPEPKLGVARRRKAKTVIVAEGDDNDEVGEGSSLVPTPQTGRRRANETWPEAIRRRKAVVGSVARGDRLVEQFADDGIPAHLVDLTMPEHSESRILLTHNEESFLSPADTSLTLTTVDTSFRPNIATVYGNRLAVESFGAIILKLHAGPGLPMVHSSKIDFSSDAPFVATHWTCPSAPINAANDLSSKLGLSAALQPMDEEEEATSLYSGAYETGVENLFVSRGSPTYALAGQVRKVQFCDNIRDRRELADVMVCTASTCELCCAGEPSPAGWLSESDEAALPMVYEEDVVSIGCQGYAYSPAGRQEAPQEVYRTTGRVFDVLFSGGKTVKAEIIRDSSDLVNPFFLSSSDGVLDDGILEDGVLWDTNVGDSFLS
jgi:hypothetical protein